MTKIALAQTTTTDDFEANLKVAEKMVVEAAGNGAALLAFPEVFLYLGGLILHLPRKLVSLAPG